MTHEDYTQKRIENHSQTIIRLADEKAQIAIHKGHKAQMINLCKFVGIVIASAIVMIWIMKLI